MAMTANEVMRTARILGLKTEEQENLLAAATHALTGTELLVITQDNTLPNALLHLNRCGYHFRFLPPEQRFAGGSPISPLCRSENGIEGCFHG